MLNARLVAAVLAVAVAIVAVAAGCGDDDETTTAASEVDGAFLAQMTPHHEMAIEMAEIAEARAEHRQVRDLAAAIVAAQAAEIEQMGQIYERLYGEQLGTMHHGSLGMSAEEMGMHMDPMHLEDADPFDRAFIDAMIPHHQGAIRMARIELADGSDPETMELARAIIDAQSREIEQMNAWRQRWYGATSPAGGMPHDTGGMHGGEAMAH